MNAFQQKIHMKVVNVTLGQALVFILRNILSGFIYF